MTGDLLEAVRRIAMRLPEVEERLSHGAPCFYRGRALCYFHDAEFDRNHRISIWCPSPPGVADEIVTAEPSRFFHPQPSAAGVFSTWLGVYLDAAEANDWSEIATIIEDACRLVAPRRLVTQVDEA